MNPSGSHTPGAGKQKHDTLQWTKVSFTFTKEYDDERKLNYTEQEGEKPRKDNCFRPAPLRSYNHQQPAQRSDTVTELKEQVGGHSKLV